MRVATSCANCALSPIFLDMGELILLRPLVYRFWVYDLTQRCRQPPFYVPGLTKFEQINVLIRVCVKIEELVRPMDVVNEFLGLPP